MVDEAVVARLLKVLALGKGFKTPQEQLFIHANLKLVPHRSPETLLENVQFAAGQGWIASDVDAYRHPRHWLTDGGEIEAAKYS
jgi:hypothetical protein